MSDNYFDEDLVWGEPQKIDGSLTEGASNKQFASYGLYKLEAIKRVTPFVAGEKLTLSHLIINGEPYQSLMAMREDKTGWAKAYVFSMEGINVKTGEPFKRADTFTTNPAYWVSTKGDPNPKQATGFKEQYFPKETLPHIQLTQEQEDLYKADGQVKISDWVNLAYPAMEAGFTKEQFEQLKKGGLYIKSENTVYQLKTNFDKLDDKGKPKLYRLTYRHGFVVYPTKEAMLAAQKADFVESGDSQPASPYPTTWAITEQWPLSTYLNIAKKSLADNPNDLKEAAKAAKLLNPDGSLAATPNGSTVSVETIATVFGKTVAEVKAAGIVTEDELPF